MSNRIGRVKPRKLMAPPTSNLHKLRSLKNKLQDNSEREVKQEEGEKEWVEGSGRVGGEGWWIQPGGSAGRRVAGSMRG